MLVILNVTHLFEDSHNIFFFRQWIYGGVITTNNDEVWNLSDLAALLHVGEKD